MRGKVVLVTGASSGIGAALAESASRRGASVVLLARRADRLDALAAKLTAGGEDALALACDVTDAEAVERAVARAVEHYGALDMVLANAGFGVSGTFESLTAADYQRQFNTNVFGVIHTLHAALPHLQRRAGLIGVVGSANGYVSIPGHSAYCMSKAAVRSLCASLRHELSPQGVSITHLCPGFVKSDFRRTDNAGQPQADLADPIPHWLSAPAPDVSEEMLDAVLDRREEAVVTLHAKAAVALEKHAHGLVSQSMRMSGDLIKRWTTKPRS